MEGVVHSYEFAKGDSWTAKLHRVTGKFKIEQRGIERASVICLSLLNNKDLTTLIRKYGRADGHIDHID